jgi:hypothetical protein
VYNKTVPDDDFIKSKHVVIKTQVFLLVVLADKIKGIYTTPPQDAKIQIHVAFLAATGKIMVFLTPSMGVLDFLQAQELG